jgi:hypothetical protein
MRTVRLAALLAALVLCGLGAVAPSAFASQTETVFFEAPGDLLGVPATFQEARLRQLQSLGVRALRVTLYWRDVAPKPNHKRRPSFNQANPAAYHWGEYDLLIDRAVAMHWKVLLTVTGPVPNWATPRGEDMYSYPSTSDFEQFMRAVGERYGAKVKMFSIWNEPNQPGFLRPQYVRGKLTSPGIYRGLFFAGYAGLKSSGHFSGMTVLAGETSAVGIGTNQVPAPLAFLRGMLCLNGNYRPVEHCSQLPAAGWAQHPYANSAGPFGSPPPRDDVMIGTLGRLVTALDRAATAGAVRRDLPIYITEFGVQSYPNPVVGVPLATQAEFDAIGERIAWSNPRVASFSQYLLQDDHPRDGRVVGFQSGLETFTGRAKPAYQAFRLPLTVTRTRYSVSFWGLVRPATGPTTLMLQYSSDGGRSWHGLDTEHTGSSGYWTGTGRFVTGRLWRASWVAAGGQTFRGSPIRAYTAAGKLAG